ncbi:MAG: hypothetical protein K1X55_13360 [Chitinophagales bacterium]|nr:hypothetical protein [Chitinophagales bacterium]
MKNTRKQLFSEFPPISTETWEQLIIKDLKGADYKRKLISVSEEGIQTKPYYRLEDLTDGIRNIPKKHQPWLAVCVVNVTDVKKANKMALENLQNGAQAIQFDFNHKSFTSSELDTLFEGILMEIAPIFCTHVGDPSTLNEWLQHYFSGKAHDGSTCICYDGQWSMVNGQRSTVNGQQSTVNLEDSTYSCFEFDSKIYADSGANAIQQLGFLLAKFIDTLNEKNLRKVRFVVGTGTNYFTEIAKIRALRYLTHRVITFFKCTDFSYNIVAESTTINKSKLDHHTNMLRNTTEAMASIIGGVDFLLIHPHDALTENTSSGNRLAVNIQHMLHHESHLSKVSDIAQGSWYIEYLTNQLIEKSWDLVMDIEAKGGFAKAKEEGFIDAQVQSSFELLKRKAAERTISMIGVNKFPNANDNITAELLSTEERLATTFEELRKEVQTSSSAPAFYLLSGGHLAMRKARVNFAVNFFQVAGYKTIEDDGFDTLASAIASVSQNPTDFVVICTDNESWETWIPALAKEIGVDRLIIAGHPKLMPEVVKEINIPHYIYEGCNILDTLKRWLPSNLRG